MDDIRIALAGVGNVASALLQGMAAARPQAGDRPGLIPIVGFDVNLNKVGKPLCDGIRVSPNCANWLDVDVSRFDGPIVRGPLLDGLSAALSSVVPVDVGADVVDVAEVLRSLRVEVLVILVPTGADEAARHYATSAFHAKCAVVNGMPTEIANSPELAELAIKCGVPLVGDDTKSQVGATAVHRALMELFSARSAFVDRTIQLDWGGDTDFANLVHGGRYSAGKGRSKTEAVVWNHPETEVHINASDYVPFLRNTKEAYTRVEGRIFGNQKVRIDVHLEVQDGYNAAGTIYPAAVCAGLALRHGLSGPLDGPSAWFCKRPRTQMPDPLAYAEYDAVLKDMLRRS